MDDIFYMSSKNVRIKDIDEIAKRINVKKTFMPQSTDVLEVNIVMELWQIFVFPIIQVTFH